MGAETDARAELGPAMMTRVVVNYDPGTQTGSFFVAYYLYYKINSRTRLVSLIVFSVGLYRNDGSRA